MDSDDHVDVDSASAPSVDEVKKLIGVKEVIHLLTTKQIRMGSGERVSFVTKERTAKESTRARDTTGRILYARIFSWIEEQINIFLHGDETAQDLRHIGLLDIFGFERFDKNGFEQLCINFANEKLQQFFLKNVFKQEQEIYEHEGVKFPDISYRVHTGRRS